MVAVGGDPVDFERLLPVPGVEWTSAAPVEALVAASHDADLVVVGSRGLRGLGPLGSVSEQVGHEAACSVLVVH